MKSFPGRGVYQRGKSRLSIEASRFAALFRSRDIAVFHEFAPPPNGGGHQFLGALMRTLSRRGWRIENNTISRTTKACLFNSFNFDHHRLKRLRRKQCRMVHRLDGPIGVYRGFDDGTDRLVCSISRELADATIFQSNYSLHKHQEMGFSFTCPSVIVNAADPEIFHSRNRPSFDFGRKIKLVSTSWSDNPNKGAAIYEWLDQHLDWSRFEYSFIGRLPLRPVHIRVEPPADSHRVAEVLRNSDIYITASRNDPCSNSLIEALSCGLPAICLNSGGHPELVGRGGILFDSADEIPDALNSLISRYQEFSDHIVVPNIEVVASAYLNVMGLTPVPGVIH